MKTFEELFDKNGKYITNYTKYTEIMKLHCMLELENIPHIFKKHCDGFQVVYMSKLDTVEEVWVCDAIECHCSYCNEDNLLELQGLLNDSERLNSIKGVIGGLTAQDVFKKIKKHYEEENL